MMVKDFVANLALLIASFSIMGQIFKNQPLKLTSPLLTKLYWGLSFGILGNILMVYSIPIAPGVIVDLRHLAIVVAAAFGGFIPALISAVFMALGRIVLFGYNPSSVLPSIGILLTGFLCGGISKMKLGSTSKAFLMNLIGLLIISGILAIRMMDPKVLINVLIVHYTISLIGGFIAYHFLVFVTKSNEANEILNRLSYLDSLTGIANRRYFDNTLDREWMNSISTHAPLSLLMFDIDYFKKYNDTYGHLAGDFCLQSIADAVKSLISIDSRYTFCRYGGEEFAVILPFTDAEKAYSIAKEIKETVRSLKIPHSRSDIADCVTLSIGVATIIPVPSSMPQILIEKADTALYLSKTKGRNTISLVTT
jgi:diguanylate cyclase